MRPTRQQEIIDAAREEFVEQGYGAASIRDIAQRCGMSMSALYHYYPGKQDLLKAILDEGVEAYFDACERALAAAGPIRPSGCRSWWRPRSCSAPTTRSRAAS